MASAKNETLIIVFYYPINLRKHVIVGQAECEINPAGARVSQVSKIRDTKLTLLLQYFTKSTLFGLKGQSNKIFILTDWSVAKVL